MTKTILVTGCAGFIGSNFVRQCMEQFPSMRVVGIDDFSTGRAESLDPSVVFYRGSILDAKLLENIFSKNEPAYVFHFAALPRISYSIAHTRRSSEVNIIGTVALLEASRNHHVKRFIYSSSSSVYGDAKKLPTTEWENSPNPRSPYAIQKYTGEAFCKVFSDLFSLDTVCLRYFSVYGPWQYGDSPYSTLVGAWLESLYFPQNKKAFIEGDGNQSRDFCYVGNVISANILAMQSRKGFRGRAINIASGKRITNNEVQALIEKYTGRKLDLEKRPPRKGDVRHTHADISLAKKLLGYQPEIDFEEGLELTAKWFKDR